MKTRCEVPFKGVLSRGKALFAFPPQHWLRQESLSQWHQGPIP